MQIGLISDIHCRADALERALDLFGRQQVDKILCAGDLVELGSDGSPVLRRIQDAAIPCVQGNHDRWVLEHHTRLRSSSEPYPDRLDDDLFEFLVGLPLEQRYEFEGKRILVTHATTWSQEDRLFYKRPDDYRRVAREANADIVVLGHTHVALHVCVEGVHIVNPGSVWSEYTEEFRTCAILSLPDFVFRVYNLANGQPVMISIGMD